MTSRRTIGVATAAVLIAVLAASGVVTLGVSVSQLSASNAALRTQIESLGEVPVAPPVIGEVGDTGPAGPPGSPGIGIPGVDGDDGEDGDPGRPGVTGQTGPQGRPPTAAEISAAIADFCAANDDCRGPTGATGATGAPGSTGTTGETGPPGADSTVPGPEGPPGPSGPSCPDGYTLQIVWIRASEDDTEPIQRQQAAICLPTTPTEGATP